MFDLDLSKIVLVGAVALVVIGPKDLPAALRTLGRALRHARRVQAEVRAAVANFAAEADLDEVRREMASLETSVAQDIAVNPATAMRGSLPSGASARARLAEEEAARHFVSPEMQAYLAPPAEAPQAGAEVHAEVQAEAEAQPAEGGELQAAGGGASRAAA